MSAGNKVYNGNTLADLFGTASVSPLGSDAVVLSGTGIANFADKNVGNNKTVTVSGYTLSGADAANYNLVQPTGGLKGKYYPSHFNLYCRCSDLSSMAMQSLVNGTE